MTSVDRDEESFTGTSSVEMNRSISVATGSNSTDSTLTSFVPQASSSDYESAFTITPTCIINLPCAGRPTENDSKLGKTKVLTSSL